MTYKTEVPFNIDEKPAFKTMMGNGKNVWRDKIKLWENAELIQLDVPVKPEEAKKILPFGVRLSNPPMATLFIANYVKTAFTCNYLESALLIHVRTLFGKGVHCCWIVVDDDTALIYGRELLGFPKKMANISYNKKNKKITAGVSRRGTQILSLEIACTTKEKDPAPVFNKKFFLSGGLGQFFLINPLWCIKPREIIHKSYNADVKLSLNHSYYDPIKTIISDDPNPIKARVTTIDILSPRLMFPAGIAGFKSHYNSYNMRFR